jgi:Bacterial Ig-like domain (group 3)/FG-GAP-like repeat
MPLRRALSSPVVFLIALFAMVLAALAQSARKVEAGPQGPAAQSAMQRPGWQTLPTPFPGPQVANPPLRAPRPFDPIRPFAGVAKKPGGAQAAQVILPTFGALTNPIFQVASTFPQGYLAGGLASADFNGDGKNDLAVLNDCVDTSYPCTNVGSVTIELGNGDGSFTTGATYQVQSNPAWVVTGDFNGDGKADLAISNLNCFDAKCSASVSILLSNGDGTFTALAPMAAGYLADGMAVGDFNHDGHLDLAVVDITATPSCCRGALLIFLGNGDGTFQSPVSYTLEDSPQTIVAADFNGDGNLDLAVTNACLDSQACTRNSTNGVVYVFFGDGAGGFSSPSLIYTPLAIDYIAAGDFNADGAPDLVVQNLCADFTLNACNQHETNTILMNDGHGNFSIGASLPAGPQPSGLTVADLNHDGKADVISTNSLQGTTSVFFSNGDGTFLPGVPYLSGPISGFVLPGDWNGDGSVDLAVAHYCGDPSCNDRTGSVSLMLGSGDGSLQAALSYSSGGTDSPSVAVADVNGDGKPDLLVANRCAINSCNGSVAVLLGNGDGTFKAAASYGSGGLYAYSVAIADVDGDGKPDLLVANLCAIDNCSVSTVGVLLGNGDGTFQAVAVYGFGGFDSISVAVADVNGDGKPDLLVANYCATSSNCNGGTVSVLLGNGDGTFQTAASYGSGGSYAISVTVGDVNGDGKPDLLVANHCATSDCGSGGSVSLLLGNGDGTFQTAASYGSGGWYAISVAVGDVNGDGKPDLLVANYCVSSSNCSGGTVGVLLGNGDGTFQVAANYSSGGTDAYSVAVGDVNGDGKPDLLVANYCATFSNCNGGTVAALLGNGDGTFQAAQSYDTAYGTQSIALGDMNGDGRLDVAAANGGNGNPSITILRNILSAPAATAVSLTASLTTGAAFQPVTFTATVTSALIGTTTGSVSFTDNGSPLGSSTVNGSGKAVFTTSTLGAGSHFIVGYYSGDYSYAPSNSYGVGVKVTQGTSATTLGSALNPSVYGQSVTFSANVTSTYGAPTGTVTFSSGLTTLGTAAVTAGVARLIYASLPVGSDPVTASYSGDTNFTGSNSAALSQAVTPAGSTLTLGSNLNPSVYGQTVSFTATVMPQYGV